jgi:hypothetical protein
MAISGKEMIRSGQLCNPPQPERLLTELRGCRFSFLYSGCHSESIATQRSCVAIGKPERIEVCLNSNPLALLWTKIIDSLIGFEARDLGGIYRAVEKP